MPNSPRQTEISPLRTIEELHKLTGRSRRLIAQRLAGVPFTPGPKNARRYPAPVALPLIMADGSREALTQARALLAYHQANLYELKRDRLAAELVPASVVRDVWQQILANATATLRGMVPAAARAVYGEKDSHIAEDKMTAVVHDTLHRLADFMPEVRA